MSTWKELPRPATPGPWRLTPGENESEYVCTCGALGGDPSVWADVNVPDVHEDDNAAAIAALPDYVAEVDRLRAWVDTRFIVDWEIADRIRAGEWPDGGKP